jgi:UPF0176 protein
VKKNLQGCIVFDMEYKVLAYYIFTHIEDPAKEVKRHKEILNRLDGKARIYISEEGVNAQLSLPALNTEAYITWLNEDERFKGTEVKFHDYPEHAFAKLTVKVRRELVAVDRKIDLSKRGEYLSPAEWKAKLDVKDQETIIIDVRNNYESDVGHFEGAILPDLETFRGFPEYAKHLAKTTDTKKAKVMMYCTGGIRCELYSALLKDEGFDTVYQLKGGVIQYGLDEGTAHWRGKLFVFDDRLVVPISEDNTEIISQCKFCGVPSDVYYNCANMDCNELFLSCSKCVGETKGCCSVKCLSEGRVREFTPEVKPKPFRKLHKDEKCACSIR